MKRTFTRTMMIENLEEATFRNSYVDMLIR